MLIVIVLVILLNLLAEYKFHQFFPLKRKIIKIKKFAKTLMNFTKSRDIMMTSFIFKDNLRSGSIFVSLLKITFWRAWRNEKRAWYKPSTKRLPPTFLIDWHLPNQPTKITSVACFSSMQIFHAWEKCRMADLKNSFYLLFFSAKNKTVSTITFSFVRD